MFFRDLKCTSHGEYWCEFCCKGNMVARGTDRGPDALAVSWDSKHLAFVGPTEYTVTITDTRSLNEVHITIN